MCFEKQYIILIYLINFYLILIIVEKHCLDKLSLQINASLSIYISDFIELPLLKIFVFIHINFRRIFPIWLKYSYFKLKLFTLSTKLSTTLILFELF